jgi:hypothetical protein
MCGAKKRGITVSPLFPPIAAVMPDMKKQVKKMSFSNITGNREIILVHIVQFIFTEKICFLIIKYQKLLILYCRGYVLFIVDRLALKYYCRSAV